jgi:hypothetical protein
METSQYLEAEILRLKKSATINYVVGAVLSLLIVVYAFIALGFVGILEDPVSLSRYAVDKVRVKGPETVLKIEQALKGKAPEVADGLSEAVQKSIPDLRYTIQNNIDASLTQSFKEMQGGVIGVVNAWMDAHATEIAHRQGETPTVYAGRVVDALTADFGKNLEGLVPQSMGISLNTLQDHSEFVLTKLDSHFGELLSNKTPSRSLQLERFLIAHIVNAYLASSPDLK